MDWSHAQLLADVGNPVLATIVKNGFNATHPPGIPARWDGDTMTIGAHRPTRKKDGTYEPHPSIADGTAEGKLWAHRKALIAEVTRK